MIRVKGYAAKNAKTKLAPFDFKRRDLNIDDVLIDIHYCGICHSDIHQVRDEWENAKYPMVPGHEIAGKVVRVGRSVKKFKVGDHVGVGCFVDSCRKCQYCKEGDQQFCEKHVAFTYNSTEMDEKTLTFGGYSNQMVVQEGYVLKIPKSIPLDKAAPLLCAGITTYSPLKQYGVSAKHKIGVIGLGGLGHMGVKIAASLGAHVTVFSTSANKVKDAKKFGAKEFVVTKDKNVFEKLKNKFDLLLDTVSAPHDLNDYLGLLRRDGVMVLVGVPEENPSLDPFALIGNRRKLAGSLIGGIPATQEMLNYCARKKIYPEIEVIPMQKVNEAYDRTVKGDIRYRFVIDCKTL